MCAIDAQAIWSDFSRLFFSFKDNDTHTHTISMACVEGVDWVVVHLIFTIVEMFIPFGQFKSCANNIIEQKQPSLMDGHTLFGWEKSQVQWYFG